MQLTELKKRCRAAEDERDALRRERDRGLRDGEREEEDRKRWREVRDKERQGHDALKAQAALLKVEAGEREKEVRRRVFWKSSADRRLASLVAVAVAFSSLLLSRLLHRSDIINTSPLCSATRFARRSLRRRGGKGRTL